MEQVQNSILYMLQTMTLSQQTAAPAPKSEETTSFQKLMEEKAQPVKNESQPKEEPKAEETQQASANQEQEQMEDPQETLRKLAEAGFIQVMNVAEAPAVVVKPVEEGGDPGLTVALPDNEAPAEIMTLDRAVVQHQGTLVPAEQARQPQLQQQPQLQPLTQPQTQPQKQTVEVVTQEQPQAAAPVQTENAPMENHMEQPKDSLPTTTGESDPTVEVENAVSAESQPIFRDVESVPVKVGETPAPARSEEIPGMDKQIDQKLIQALESGESKVEIRLTPEYLGTVTVEITRQENGALHVVLAAENSQTRGLLEQHTTNLQSLLSGHGQETVQVEVQRSQEGQQNAQNYDGRNGSDQHGEQQQERRQHQQRDSQDFLQQLRLGMIPLDEVS